MAIEDDLIQLQADLEREFIGKLQSVIMAAMLDAADRHEATGNPSIPDDFHGKIDAAMREVWQRSIVGTGRMMMEEFKDGFDHIERKESFWERMFSEFVMRWGARKIVRVLEATREQVRRIVSQGLTLPEAAREIRESAPELSRLRAITIARTETHTASMFAGDATARESRRELVKTWVSTEDARTRDFGESDGVVDEFSHRAMDGVRVPNDDFFMVPRRDGTLEPLRYPGDPDGSAGNVINCRCAMKWRRANR